MELAPTPRYTWPKTLIVSVNRVGEMDTAATITAVVQEK